MNANAAGPYRAAQTPSRPPWRKGVLWTNVLLALVAVVALLWGSVALWKSTNWRGQTQRAAAEGAATAALRSFLPGNVAVGRALCRCDVYAPGPAGTCSCAVQVGRRQTFVVYCDDDPLEYNDGCDLDPERSLRLLRDVLDEAEPRSATGRQVD